MQQFNKFLALSVVSVAMLSACGGGGSDSGSAGPGSSARLPITSANYVTVSQEALSTSYFMADSGGLVTGAKVLDERQLMAFVRSQSALMPSRLHGAPKVVTGATQTLTEACDGGLGSISLTLTDLNGNGDLDTGDSVAIAASNCSFNGDTMSGSMTMSVASITGNLSGTVYEVNYNIAINGLSVISGGDKITGSGNMRLGMVSTGLNRTVTTISVDSFQVVGTQGGINANRGLSDFRFVDEHTPSGSSYSSAVSVSGTLSSSALGEQAVSFVTAKPFVRAGNALYPTSGSAVITGAGNSQARITVQSGSAVLLELDANGDGSFETSTTKPWYELV